MKNAMVQHMNDCQTFEASSLNVARLRCPDFWVGHTFTYAEHPRLRELCTTTRQSCLLTLQESFEQHDNGDKWSNRKFAQMAKKLAIFTNMWNGGIFCRLGLSEATSMFTRGLVVGGDYDDDLDKLMALGDDAAPVDAAGFDDYLSKSFSLIKAVVKHDKEFEAEASATGTGEPLARVSAAGSVEATPPPRRDAWVSEDFLEAVEEDVRKFEDFMQQREEVCAELAKNEEAYVQSVSPDAQAVAKDFGDKYVPMPPFKADYKQVLSSLPKIMDDRLSQVGAYCGCDCSDILRVPSCSNVLASVDLFF